MHQVFWLRKPILAGRSGPNRHPWDIAAFKESGFSAILSVNGGDMVHESLIESFGLEYANIPMSSNAPVREGDKALCLANLPKTVKFIASHRANGPVLVHCRSGKDRTGLVLAASLMAIEGLDVQAAMNAVLEVRPIAFSAEGWLTFSQDVLTEFRSRHLGLQSPR